MDTKEKAEKVRQELAKIVRTYNRYPVLGMFENWPASGLLKLATGAVCGLLFNWMFAAPIFVKRTRNIKNYIPFVLLLYPVLRMRTVLPRMMFFINKR